MQPVVVVVPDVVEQSRASLRSGLDRPIGIDVLVLERGEPGLHRCVVQCALSLADGNQQAVPGGSVVPFMGGELIAAVGMDDATGGGSAQTNSVEQRPDRRLGCLVGVGRPA